MNLIKDIWIVFVLNEGVTAWNNDNTKDFHQRSVEVVRKNTAPVNLRNVFNQYANTEFGAGRWKMPYYTASIPLTDTFIIERSNLTTIEGELFLKGYGKYEGHCHSLESVNDLLASPIFREHNPSLISIFEKAKAKMEKDETGIVE